jgi:AcrR family transcriptional regulator
MTVTNDGRALTLRERRSEQLRSEIEHVALREFAQRGYDAVTVDDIATAAGISVRTFFRYFPAKDEVLVAELRRTIDRIAADVAARPDEESAVEALHDALLSQVAVVDVDREVSGDWYQTVADNPALLAKAAAMASAHRRTVTDLLALRLGVDPATDLRPGVITSTMFAAADHASRVWLDGGAEGSLPEITGRALAFVEDGLRSIERPARRRSGGKDR